MAASDDRRLPDEQTLFHLIPLNEQAETAVYDADNSRCVSISTTCGRNGLEVGFHVPPNSRGDVITRLGRDADLTLNHPTVSSRHVDFHLNMHTHMVMLRVLSKDEASVSVALDSSEDAGVDMDMGGVDAPERDECRDNLGDCVLLYGRTYQINICTYKFSLIWVRKPCEELKAIALEGQKVSAAKAKELPERKRPTPTDLLSYLSRPPDNPECPIRETADSRELKHESQFATVHKALDNSSGNNIAVVTVRLIKFGVQRKDEARAAIHHEVTSLKKHRHNHIIPCLGSKNFETDEPVFYNELADGDISRLPRIQKTLWEGALGRRMLRQMLGALAYLAENNMCHGSIEPAKILYRYYDNDETQNGTEVDKYVFKLSHFGISKYAAKPPAQFRAPELWDDNEPDPAKLVTPKTDVWCLLAAYAATHPSTQRDISQVSSLSALRQVMAKVGQLWPLLNPMATEKPTERASASQMIHFLTGPRGPTQPPGGSGPAHSPGAPGPTQAPGGSDPAHSPGAPGPTPPPLGAGGPADDPADSDRRELEPSIIEAIRYNMRTETLRQRAVQIRANPQQRNQRRSSRYRPGQRRNRAGQRRNDRHHPY